MDEHTAAGLLKLYLRERADPVCTFELYDAFLGALDVVLARQGHGGECIEAGRSFSLSVYCGHSLLLTKITRQCTAC